MTILLIIAGFFVSFSTALLLTPSFRQFALKRRWVDEPDGKRKIHSTPIPRVGGIVILIAFCMGIGFFLIFREYLGVRMNSPSWMMLIAATLISMVGLYDDIKGLGFKRKFVAQIFVSCLMVHAGYRFDISGLSFLADDLYLQNAYSMILTLVWYVGIMNAVNLIDGLDGLAGGIAVIAFGSLALVFNFSDNLSSILFVMAITGAITGFLVHNFNPASIFMGDSGSLFIGFLLATYALEGTSHRDPILAIVILAMAIGLPILDTSVAFLRRILEGKSPFFPDSDHIHHRLTRNFNLSPKVAVVLLYGVNVTLGALAIFLVIIDPNYTALIMGTTLLLIYVLLRRLGYIKIRDIVRMMDGQFGRRGPFDDDPPGSARPAPAPAPTPVSDGQSENGHIEHTAPQPSSNVDEAVNSDVLSAWTEESVRSCWNEVEKELTKEPKKAIKFNRPSIVLGDRTNEMVERTSGRSGVTL